MKILCLHGFGSSGKILEGQLTGLIRASDPTYEFVFVDGPVKAPRGPGISPAIPGPFYSHTTGYTLAELGEAADHITSYIEYLGPFDGVIGFSQGAAQAISYMYQLQNRYNQQSVESDAGDTTLNSPPFKFAICISSTIPISGDPSCYKELLRGISISLIEKKLDAQQTIFVNCLTQSFQSGKKVGAIESDLDDDFLKVGKAAGEQWRHDEDSDRNDFLTDLIPRVMHPDLLPQRLRIPTVHVTGKQDLPFMNEMADLARRLCDPKLVRIVQHSGGHSIPRKPSEILQVVQALEWAVDRASKL